VTRGKKGLMEEDSAAKQIILHAENFPEATVQKVYKVKDKIHNLI
jgi:hypothetical protein